MIVIVKFGVGRSYSADSGLDSFQQKKSFKATYLELNVHDIRNKYSFIPGFRFKLDSKCVRIERDLKWV